MTIKMPTWPARVYDEPHNHEPQWCICWSLGSYAQMTCRGTCHAEQAPPVSGVVEESS